jgi:tetratricopeptide (TPR) repeat protein
MKRLFVATSFLVLSSYTMAQNKADSLSANRTKSVFDGITSVASIISALIGVGILGYIIKMKDQQVKVKEEILNLKDQQGQVKNEIVLLKDAQIALQQEKIGLKDDQLTIKEKDLLKAQQAIEDLEQKLNNALNEKGINFQKLAEGQKLNSNNEEIKQLTNELVKILNEQSGTYLKTIDERFEKIVSNSNLTIAKSQMAQGNFDAATKAFDYYEQTDNISWDVYFSKAVAYANLRGGRKSDIQSIRAYNDAITFLPADVNPNARARVFAYRGAIYKRINRFDEALNDLDIARKYATNPYEIDDINYNLSAIYAMIGDKEKMMEFIGKIKSHKYLNHIHNHLNDYYSKFANDSDLLRAIG